MNNEKHCFLLPFLMLTPLTHTAGCTVAMFWRHARTWRQTGTSGRELDKSRWRPTLKQERDFRINKTRSETSLNLSAASTRRRLDFERTGRSRYRWEESVCLGELSFVSGAVAAETAVRPIQPHNITARPLAKLSVLAWTVAFPKKTLASGLRMVIVSEFHLFDLYIPSIPTNVVDFSAKMSLIMFVVSALS